MPLSSKSIALYATALAFSCQVLIITTNSSYIALENVHKKQPSNEQQETRFKRQIDIQTAGQPQSQQTRSPSAAELAAASQAAGNGQPPSEANTGGSGQQGEEGERVETLSSLKCDFGSADSPDLCKFKILQPIGPLSKLMSSWQFGSGKLALYQGGPLVDASDRNDTTGGYIFYETSNLFASSSPASNASLPVIGSQHSNEQYYSISSSPSSMRTIKNFSQYRANSDELVEKHEQHLSSARISVNNQATPANQFGPSFVSPNLTAPGPSGMCLAFKYAINGLSAEELRIFVNDHKSERSRQIWSSSESAKGNWTKGEVLYSVTNIHSLIFAAGSNMITSTNGAHSASAGLKDLQARKFRGYLALDEIEVNKHDFGGTGSEACKGHCNLDGDLCGWSNGENNEEDDFDWSFGRGSDNLFTGPARDYVSSLNNDLTGSYLFTDSGYPRRPGDRATLISPMFQPTAMNEAMCMRFAVHMFGSGVGSLAIKLRYSDAEAVISQPSAPGQQGGGSPAVAGGASVQGPAATGSAGGVGRSAASAEQRANDQIIWEMSGDSGNVWHQAQTSVSSAKSSFQVLIEGTIGENHLGNIAIDEISFSNGPCPTSPPVASKNYGDCTFEQSMCYWRNPDAEIHLDDLNWIRLSADEPSLHGPNFDHTLKRKSGFYLKLENTFREPKSGSRAFLLSPIFQPKSQGSVQCLSFYYYMFMRSVGSSGPNLGTIRVYLASNNDLIPIWRLTNPISSPSWKHARASLSTALIDGQPTAPSKLFQIAFEGIWGDAAGGAIALDDITVFDGACDIMPMEAKSVAGECTFDVDMCSWVNKTTSPMMSTQGDASLNSVDASKSPFLQSVSGGSSALASGARLTSSSKMSWQLATVESRPVNLQDHTYKAPIGYTYIDVLENGRQPQMGLSYVLQSQESVVQQGQQQVIQCLSFWFAAFGRHDSNKLQVYLTQASAPPQPAEDAGQPAKPVVAQAANNPSNQPSSGSPSAGAGSVTSSSDADQENSNAWKLIEGKLLWSAALKNVTEINRRKWQYGQVTLKADSNYIVRFVASSTDGGFALDDVSYYEGPCNTRPAHAKVVNEDDDAPSAPGTLDSTNSQNNGQVKPAR